MAGSAGSTRPGRRRCSASSSRWIDLDGVVFTWGWETALFKTPPQSTLVEVSLTRDGEDTLVRLAHRRLKPEAVALHRAGWQHYLPRLALAASGGDPGRDPWRDLALNVEELRAAGVLP
ncbi:MAG TPA: SRPBCC domain-containing protein [Solirubrobacteraceae bacterium]|nr:SRPBCC domain-containing protein [Solirubrobacteraceae bacterium]